MPARNGLAVTSMILGVLSVLFVMMGLSLPIGALGIITALLSRGSQGLSQQAKIGLAVSLAAITAGICVIIWSFHVMNSAEFQTLMQQYMSVYGLAE